MPDVADSTVKWELINSYTDAPIPLLRGTPTAPLILNQKVDGLRAAYGSAYKELAKILIAKYKTVADSVESTQLNASNTRIDSLSTACETLSIVSTDTLATYYAKTDTDISTITGVVITSETADSNAITVNEPTTVDTTLQPYIQITDAGSTGTGAWPTLYQRIKCIALVPLAEYIGYVGSLSPTQTLPTGFPSNTDAIADRTRINSTDNILSIVSIVSIYTRYRDLIKQAKAYFLVLQFKRLVDNATDMLDIKTATATDAATKYPLTGVSMATISNMQIAYNENGSNYTTIVGGLLPNIPTDATQNANLIGTYEVAIRQLTNKIYTEYRSIAGVYPNLQLTAATTKTYYDAAATPLDPATNTVQQFYNSAWNYIKPTDGYTTALLADIRTYLRNYVSSYTAIRNWLKGSVTTDHTIASTATKGMGVTTANTPTDAPALTYPSPDNETNFTKLNERWSGTGGYVGNMGALIGASDTAADTVRKTITDKINEVANYYSTNSADISAETYNWLSADNAGDKNTIKTTTSVSEFVRIWNKYNIKSELAQKVNESQQLKYQTIVRDYNALYDTYDTFQKDVTTKTPYTLPALSTATNPSITRTKPDEEVKLDNYATISAKYGTETTGMYAALITFVRNQMGSYILTFYTWYDSLDEEFREETIDTNFYGESTKTEDVTATPTKSATDLVTLLANYTRYTNQMINRNDQYNTLLVIEHFEKLVKENVEYSEIFPIDMDTSKIRPEDTGPSFTVIDADGNEGTQTFYFITETGASFAKPLGTSVNNLVHDIKDDSNVVLGLPDDVNALAPNLKTIRNKYVSAFDWLYTVRLKPAMQQIIQEYEALYSDYGIFQQGYTSFSSLDALSFVKEPMTVSDTPAKLKDILDSLEFDRGLIPPNQQTVRDTFAQVRNAYLKKTGPILGVGSRLATLVYNNLTSFRGVLETRVGASKADANDKPTVPAALDAPFQNGVCVA